MVLTGLIIILILVLTIPFIFKKVEENLEPFLFVMGVAAAIISSRMTSHLIMEALWEPVMISGAVLVAGLMFYMLKEQFARLMGILCDNYPISIVVFCVVLILGFLSSVITAIVSAIILVEVIYRLPLLRKDKIVICVLACFSIGLGAVLTPIGEPLATIAISKLNQEFTFLLQLLGRYIIPFVIIFALCAALYANKASKEIINGVDIAATSEAHAEESDSLVHIEEEIVEEDTLKGVFVRAVKVYLFVMALVFLGEGFEPLINAYILGLSPELLYWVNMVSAVLDNATLCAAEISPSMLSNMITIRAILMGLLLSGGMLIPGNIPNIIAASKLKIGSKEWALLGVPIGLIFMVVCYMIIFIFGL